MTLVTKKRVYLIEHELTSDQKINVIVNKLSNRSNLIPHNITTLTEYEFKYNTFSTLDCNTKIIYRNNYEQQLNLTELSIFKAEGL